MFAGLLTSLVDYDRDLYRNIKSVRVSIDCYDDLGDGDLDSQIAIEAEMVGHQFSSSPMITRPFEYGVAIAYPFCAENRQETRFSDGRLFGVWYGCEEFETTIFETVHHWCKFISDSFSDEDVDVIADRRVFVVYCSGLLVDLRSKDNEYPSLVDKKDYSFCQKVGTYLHEQGQNAVVTNSARCEGVNVAIFDPKVLSNVRDCCFLSYRWNPKKNDPVTVERNVGETLCIISQGSDC